MISDFIIGVIASIAASIICGFLSHKVVGKNNDILSSIYTIYIGFSSFALVIILTFMLSSNIQNMLSTWSGTSVFNLVRYVTSLFWIIFVNVSIVTIVFIITRQMELNSKSTDQIYHSYMKYLQKSEMRDKENEI